MRKRFTGGKDDNEGIAAGISLYTGETSYSTFETPIWLLSLLTFLIAISLISLCLNAYLVSKENGEPAERGAIHRERIKPCCFEEDDPNCDDRADCSADIIVVGCGSAGALVSSLMSDPTDPNDKKFTVVCLEEGQYKNDDPYVKYGIQDGIPNFFITEDHSTTSVRVQTDSEPVVPSWYPLVYWGSMIGGSGNHDGTLDVHPSQILLDRFAEEIDSTWSYASVQDLINEYEVYSGPVLPCSVSTGGKITGTNIDVNPDVDSANYKFLQLIIPNSPVDLSNSATIDALDYNCYELSTESHMRLFQKIINSTTTLRTSAGQNYLDSTVITASGYGVGGRKLRVIPNTLVNKFQLDENLHARSVLATVKGRTRRFYANRQIVISANAIRSPGIIERSGVGDPDTLTSMGIPVLVNLPEVGENLQTHMGSAFIFVTNDTVYGSSFILSGHALLTVLPDYDGERAIQLLQIPGMYNPGHAGQVITELGDIPDLPEGYAPVSTLISNLRPRSKGSVHLSGPEPSRFPTVKFNVYTDPDDVDIGSVIETLNILYAALLQLRSENPGYDYALVSPEESVFSSESRLRQYVLDLPFIQYHYSSSNSIGPVLNGDLSLKGVTGVTVADTSSWPEINNGNTRTQALITGAYAATHLLQTLPAH